MALGRAGRHDWISVAEESVSVRKRGLLDELERLRAEQHQTLLEELERVSAEQDHVGDDGGDESNSGDSGDEAHDTKDANSSAVATVEKTPTTPVSRRRAWTMMMREMEDFF